MRYKQIGLFVSKPAELVQIQHHANKTNRAIIVTLTEHRYSLYLSYIVVGLADKSTKTGLLIGMFDPWYTLYHTSLNYDLINLSNIFHHSRQYKSYELINKKQGINLILSKHLKTYSEKDIVFFT